MKSAIGQSIYDCFDENMRVQIHDMLNDMLCTDTYDLVVLVAKKGYCFVNAVISSGALKINDSITICSDRIVGSAEFIKLLEGKQNICIFDDSIRYGRKVNNVYNIIDSLCKELNQKTNIDVRVIAKSKLYSSDNIPDNNLYCVIDNCGISEMDRNASSVIKTLYHGKYPYAVGAPKTVIKYMTNDELKKLTTNLKFEAMSGSNSLHLLDDLGILLWERFFDVNEMICRFENSLGLFVSYSNIELYAYNKKNNDSKIPVQVVARASLSRITIENVDRILLGILNIFIGYSDEAIYNIDEYSPKIKYEFINYVMSIMVSLEFFGVSDFRFDLEILNHHFGNAYSSFLIDIISKFMNDYNKSKRELIFLFKQLGDSLLNDAATENLDNDCIAVYDKIFNDCNGFECNFSNLIWLQSKRDFLRNTGENYFNLDEIPFSLVMNYFSNKYGYNNDANVMVIRRELVNCQIEGKAVVSTKTDEKNRFIEKFIKAGEMAYAIRYREFRMFYVYNYLIDHFNIKNDYRRLSILFKGTEQIINDILNKSSSIKYVSNVLIDNENKKFYSAINALEHICVIDIDTKKSDLYTQKWVYAAFNDCRSISSMVQDTNLGLKSENIVVRELDPLCTCLHSDNRFYSIQKQLNMGIKDLGGEYADINEKESGDTMTKKLIIRDLSEAWPHIHERDMELLMSLEEGLLNDLHDLFVEFKQVETIENATPDLSEYNDNLNVMYVEDCIVKLSDKATLLFRIGCKLIKKNGFIYKISMSLDQSFALIIYDYNSDKYLDFTKYVSEQVEHIFK